MINGWRRAFCTSIPKARNNDEDDDGVFDVESSDTQRLRHKSTSRFSFFSTPSTPRSDSGSIYKLRCRTSTATASSPSPSLPETPKLKCRTTTTTVETTPITTPTRNNSLVSSPASFSLLKSKLRFNKVNRFRTFLFLKSFLF